MLFLVALGNYSARAGGIELYEIATPDVGLASAGYTARAQDASTLFKNPAGMSQLEGKQFQGGMQALYAKMEFSPNNDTSARLGTDDGGNAVGFLPALSGFLVEPVSEKLRVGFGMLSYFGLASEYDNDWVGRYYIQKGTLIGITLMPSVSYEVNDWLSIGAGMNAMYGYFNSDIAVNNLDPLIGDGQMSLKDGVWGFGANGGILITPCKSTRIGLTYMSRVKLDFQDRPSFSNLGPVLGNILANPGKLDLGMTVPQGAMLGAYHEFSAEWALMADVGWQDWSQFGYVQAGVENGGTTTLNLQYQDTWHGAAGVIYNYSPKWKFTGGVAYDSSAVSDANRTVTLPMGRAFRFGLGATLQASERVSWNFAHTLLLSGDMPVDQGSDLSLRGRVAGSYDNVWVSITTINFTWNF